MVLLARHDRNRRFDLSSDAVILDELFSSLFGHFWDRSALTTALRTVRRIVADRFRCLSCIESQLLELVAQGLLIIQVSNTLHQSLGTEKNCLLALDRRIEISSQGDVGTHLGLEPPQSRCRIRLVPGIGDPAGRGFDTTRAPTDRARVRQKRPREPSLTVSHRARRYDRGCCVSLVEVGVRVPLTPPSRGRSALPPPPPRGRAPPACSQCVCQCASRRVRDSKRGCYGDLLLRPLITDIWVLPDEAPVLIRRQPPEPVHRPPGSPPAWRSSIHCGRTRPANFAMAGRSRGQAVMRSRRRNPITPKARRTAVATVRATTAPADRSWAGYCPM